MDFMINNLKVATVAVFAFMFAGCSAPVRPFSAMELKDGEPARMAILPFDNLSQTPGAGKSLENIILIEFLKHSPLKILDPGEVTAALSEERVRLATNIPKETVLTLGKKLGVDYFMIGVIHDYEMHTATGAGGSGQVPVIAMTIRIINAGDGNIVWASNATRSGKDKETVFGIGKIESLNNLAEKTAQELAEAFAASVRRKIQ